jgi:hypothetical protein
MKKIILFITLCYLKMESQTPNYVWAEGFGGNGYDGMKIATDAAGNVYGAGFFQSDSITIGNFTFYNDSLQSYKGDIFLAKFNSNGNVIWAKKMGGQGSEDMGAVTVDVSGNVYIGGSFTSPNLAFGSYTLINTTGCGFAFFAKYDSSGNVLWARQGVIAGSTGNATVSNITSDINGNILATGGFGGNTISFNGITLTNNGYTNCFIVKMDSSGTFLWGKSALNGVGDGVMGEGVANDKEGNVYVTGYFNASHITFGSVNLVNSYVGFTDVFIVKYGSTGNVIWAKKAGGAQYDNGYGLVIDNNDNVYVMGTFDSPHFSIGSYTITNIANNSLFLARLDTGGNANWIKSTSGSNSYCLPFGICSDKYGNTYITGYYAYAPTAFGSFTLTAIAGGPDIFIASYDSTGNALWAESGGGNGNDQGRCVQVDLFGNIYLSAVYRSSIINNMGPNVLTNSHGNDDILLAKIGLITNVKYVEELKNSFVIYPNPARETIYVESMKDNREKQILIRDLLGNTVKETSETTIEVSNLPNGVYFATVLTDKEISTKKFVISR